MALALFDLDNTLLAGDSDYLWGVFLSEQGVVDTDHYEQQNQRFYDAYKKGTLDIHAFQAFSQQPLVDNNIDTMKALRQQFVEQKIHPIMTAAGIRLVEKHREQGDTLVIITATNSFVTRPIADAFGIDNLLATEPEVIDGKYTGKIAGTPCFQDGKVVRLKAWMQEHGLSMQGSWFYSDSHNDLPLLLEVDNPVVVDADEQLLSHARRAGWPSISLRE